MGNVAQNNGIPPKHALAHLNKNMLDKRKGPISNACASCRNEQKSPRIFVPVCPPLFSYALRVWYNTAWLPQELGFCGIGFNCAYLVICHVEVNCIIRVVLIVKSQEMNHYSLSRKKSFQAVFEFFFLWLSCVCNNLASGCHCIQWMGPASDRNMRDDNTVTKHTYASCAAAGKEW